MPRLSGPVVIRVTRLMIRFSPSRLFGVFTLALLCSISRSQAQGFGLSVSATTNSVSVNNPVTFNISLTNQTGLELLSVLVTNSISGSATGQITGFSVSQGTISTNATTVLFSLGSMFNGAVAQMSVTVRPTTSGTFTNSIIAVSPTVIATAETNLLVSVAPPTADLAVAIEPPAGPVVVNDLVSYGLSVTNLGVNTAANVILTNTGFGALRLLSLSPTNQSYTLTNGSLVLNAGSLAGGAGKSFELLVQPTNAGSLTLTAAVASASITESNPTNDTATAGFTVEELLGGNLIATNAASMVYNPQTGLMEQTVRLANVGTNTVASARVIVSGLTNRLYNAVGTNGGNPFVVYGASLDPGQGVDLVMEYFVPTRLPITVANSNYTAIGTSAVEWSASSAPAPNITTITNLGAAGILIEFAAIANRSYTIFYSDNMAFTNALLAQPTVVAPADRVQWIDNGPPKTVRHPTNDSSRFYRVMLNP